MSKRTRKPKADLAVWWSSKSNDLMFHWDKHKADGSLLHWMLTRPHYSPLGDILHPDPSILEELKSRGFDITTLRITINRLPEKSERKP